MNKDIRNRSACPDCYRNFNLYNVILDPVHYRFVNPFFFTALSNGVVSAVLAFSRSFVFMAVTMLVLPALLGINGIWLATPAAELMSLSLAAFLFLRHRKRYGY